MRIGTLIIKVYVAPAWILRIDKLLEIMSPLLRSVGILLKSNYTHVKIVRADMYWYVQLETYWKIDRIYTTLINYINQNFTDFELLITLTTKEEGG